MFIKQAFKILFFVIIISSCNNSNNNVNPETYKEKVKTIEEIEYSKPSDFLTVQGNYNKNFWGDKIKIHGIIKNKATVATYKDAEIKIIYYSKTETALTEKMETIYDFFPPNSEKSFELKIDNYKDVNSIGLKIVHALPKN